MGWYIWLNIDLTWKQTGSATAAGWGLQVVWRVAVTNVYIKLRSVANDLLNYSGFNINEQFWSQNVLLKNYFSTSRYKLTDVTKLGRLCFRHNLFIARTGAMHYIEPNSRPSPFRFPEGFMWFSLTSSNMRWGNDVSVYVPVGKYPS